MTSTNVKSPLSPPLLIDEDIQHTVDDILQASIFTTTAGNSDYEGLHSRNRPHQQQQQQQPPVSKELYRHLLEVAMQKERNGWKEKLQSTLQEMDRQRRASITEQYHLQELVEQLGILDTPDTDSGLGPQPTHCISALRSYIQELQESELHADFQNNMRVQLNYMQVTLTQLQNENEEHVKCLQQKAEEIQWLRKELNAIRHQLQQLQKVILHYNEIHSTKFHLDDVQTARDSSKDNLSRERTYLEGDQMEFPATPGEEVALWRTKAKHKDGDGRGKGKVRAGISQCLRCQKMFKPQENNARACRYHQKGREIREQYDPTGRLAKVFYKWACCKKGMDVHGCTYGYHI